MPGCRAGTGTFVSWMNLVESSIFTPHRPFLLLLSRDFCCSDGSCESILWAVPTCLFSVYPSHLCLGNPLPHSNHSPYVKCCSVAWLSQFKLPLSSGLLLHFARPS
ncbi:hypothetical protein CSKR_202449 [Clonorchis sinensis]|uniref:Uncharacterized protein n=1 Tax=Clonorchis sinensis TaxID=79923 RepID=A0A8T1MW41_CLOSI|nr:hypothetical protein CSKR_202449 [Clonorchis sinensis]